MAVKWQGFSDDDINKRKSWSKLNQAAMNDDVDPVTLNLVSSSSPQDRGEMTAEKNYSLGIVGLVQDGTCNSGKGRETLADNYASPETATQSISLKSFNFKPDGSGTQSLTASLLLPLLSQPPCTALDSKNFGLKHKLMEEKNRIRKVYLSQALENRKKQTHEEQLRLNMIQEELQKLDQQLSSDVSIIRNQIETASLDFMEAQKRYDRAEKEFLDAKLLLFTKLERKELLTHHLCAIIEQNEMRKAQKLSELMEKLNVVDITKEGTSSTQSVNEQSSDKESDREITPEIILNPCSVDCESLSSKET